MEKRGYVFEFSGLVMNMHKYARGGEFSIFSVTLYSRDLLIVNLWYSAQVCVAFSGCAR